MEPPANLLEQLRPMPIFELFSEEQLVWMAAQGEVVELPGGTILFRRGTMPERFWVLLRGGIEISTLVADREAAVGSAHDPGTWAGIVPYVFEENPISATLTDDSELFVIPDRVLKEMFDTGFPIVKHLMLGVTFGTQQLSARVAERERMLSLGRLSAGLAHELNNPAAASQRAADALRTALAAHEAAALDVACASPGAALVSRLAGLRDEVAKAAAAASSGVLTPLDRSDREEALGEWLVGVGVEEGYDAAPTLVDAGLDIADVDRLVPEAEGDARVPLLRWLVASTETGALVREIESATMRISDLVKAVKKYSYLDRADVGDIDVRRGIDDTLRVLKAKLEGITVERDYDPDLPAVVAHGGELNQVWTNLIDNAADALEGSGTISIVARVEGDGVVVTVADDGPGIPEEIVHRVFEPFFTTKGVGEGTGLGLDIARRVVAETSGGELSVESRPGRTIFTVTLPLIPAEL